MKAATTMLWLALFCVSSGVSAAGPWDGEWFLAPEKTRLSDHSFTLAKVAGDMWRYDDGASIYLFHADGKDYPEPLDPGLLISATQTRTRLDLTESRAGEPVQRLRKILSVDGASLASTRTSIAPDGSETTESATDIRDGAGIGFEGTWREMADTTPPRPATTKSKTSPRPFWVISSGDAGEMIWRIPATGETLKGKPDGRARPATGPQIANSETFSWEAVSEKQIEFYYYVNGHLVERATERMADDARTWSDTLWIPAYPEQKEVRVFERRSR